MKHKAGTALLPPSSFSILPPSSLPSFLPPSLLTFDLLGVDGMFLGDDELVQLAQVLVEACHACNGVVR